MEKIDYFSFKNPILYFRESASLYARKKMYYKFEEIIAPKSTDSVLDLGATPDESLEDSNFFEALYPWKDSITIASIEDCSNIVTKYGLCGFVMNEPKKPLPFKDKEFDILFCSAVIEHVGTREDQVFFLRECLRVANKVFLTTPNRWFPLEIHSGLPFVHWLPWGWFQKIASRVRDGFWSDIEHLNLLRKKDIIDMKLPNIIIDYIRTMGFKSNIIITNCFNDNSQV